MKVIHLCILVLVCVAAIKAEGEETSTNSGSTTKNTDEGTNHNAVETTTTMSNTDLEPVTQILDGKIVTFYKKTTTKRDSFKKFKKVRKFWTKGEAVESVTEVLQEFAKNHKALTEQEYNQFSNIATTDYNRYWSDYNYWEIKDMDLKVALARAFAVLKTPMSDDDIIDAVAMIQECDEHNVASVIDSSPVDINTEDGWLIYSQFFAATCSKTSEKNQIFVWAASKQGEYLPGQYGTENSKFVSETIKSWLLEHIGLLVSCTRSPTQPMHIWNPTESSINEPYSVSATETSATATETSATATVTSATATETSAKATETSATATETSAKATETSATATETSATAPATESTTTDQP